VTRTSASDAGTPDAGASDAGTAGGTQGSGADVEQTGDAATGEG